MPSTAEITAKVKDRFPAATVDVEEGGGGYRVIVAEPGHRTLVAPKIEPAMIDTGIHLLWLGRKNLESAQSEI